MFTKTLVQKRACHAQPEDAWQVLLKAHTKFDRVAEERRGEVAPQDGIRISASSPLLEVGSCYRIKQRRRPTLWVRITDLESGRFLGAEVRMAILKLRVECEIASTESGCTLVMRLCGRGPTGILLRGIPEQQLHAILQEMLKSWVEAAECQHSRRASV